MALFSNAELTAKATGYLSTVDTAEYNRAIEYALGAIEAHVRMRYDETDETSHVFKFIGLELALWHVGTEHFNEQSNPLLQQLWVRHDNAVAYLKEIAKGMMTADAASVEDSRKDVVMGVVLNADDEAVSKFGDTVTEYW